jgi:hypothetical protein
VKKNASLLGNNIVGCYFEARVETAQEILDHCAEHGRTALVGASIPLFEGVGSIKPRYDWVKSTQLAIFTDYTGRESRFATNVALSEL